MAKSKSKGGTGERRRVRCAIYTRKSSEEGLEQAFNSLDAQRAACEAYIVSQSAEGWSALPQLYDDGGLSGATMERPALQRLLSDIASGNVDTVVVYKVDRLTRSLRDFARIVDLFDAHGVSFISVTQAFNTTTSMGRLTLNMLLSFAQFEREVTGERIRDKIAASKQKGMWMGGLPPLGYDVKDRKLVVNEAEAETVRHIYRRYSELGSVRVLQKDLEAAGIVSKHRIDRFGRQTGGKSIARGALYLMLQNRIYRGEIVHKDQSYPGEHDPIVEADLWESVQRILADHRVERKTGARAAAPGLLAGLLFDDAGERMVPTHANKKGTRYRYYVSQPLIKRGRARDADVGWRVPAGDIERLVEGKILAFLGGDGDLHDVAESLAQDARERQQLLQRAASISQRWPDLSPSDRRGLMQSLVARIDLGREAVDIAIRPQAIASLGGDALPRTSDTCRPEEQTLRLSVTARLQRAGLGMRLLVEGAANERSGKPDPSLLRLIAMAHRFRTMLMQQQASTIAELAEQAGVSPSYFSRVLRLSFLSPEIVKAVLRGAQPPQLTAKQLMAHVALPRAWSDQARQLGLG